MAEVLKCYGYNTAAWGKWHNTPAEQTTSKGPFDYWPTGYGFEYFYGFLAGEASQYEPHMVRNTTPVNPHELHRKGYHLTEDIAEDAIRWLREQQAFAPDKPFLMYWAPGASHGPHHVTKEWADKYKGKFDDGWDKYRERVFARQKQLGWIPQNAKLTPRPDTLPVLGLDPRGGEAVPAAADGSLRGLHRARRLQRRPGHRRDREAGQARQHAHLLHLGRQRLVGRGAERDRSANCSPRTASRPRSSSTSRRSTTSAGSTCSARRRPTTCTTPAGPGRAARRTSPPSSSPRTSAAPGSRWPCRGPRGIKPDATPRSQFHHVIDIVPTIYEVTKITPPRVVNGVPQDSIDGVSMAYTFADAKAKGRRTTQFFDIMGSRGIYHDGWFACTFGPRTPWVPGLPKGIGEWSPEKDTWELYNLDEDWSQADDLAAKMPEKLAADEGPVPGRIGEEQEPADRRRPVDDGPPPGRRARDALHRVDVHAARSPGCPSSPRRSSASSTTPSAWTWTCPRTPTACSTRSAASPAG